MQLGARYAVRLSAFTAEPEMVKRATIWLKHGQLREFPLEEKRNN
jgi:hypothetical protein